jgi:hypothetical protein
MLFRIILYFGIGMFKKMRHLKIIIRNHLNCNKRPAVNLTISYIFFYMSTHVVHCHCELNPEVVACALSQLIVLSLVPGPLTGDHVVPLCF